MTCRAVRTAAPDAHKLAKAMGQRPRRSVQWSLADGCDPRDFIGGAANEEPHPDGCAYWRKLVAAALPNPARSVVSQWGIGVAWDDIEFVVRGWPATVIYFANEQSLVEAARVVSMTTFLNTKLAIEAAVSGL